MEGILLSELLSAVDKAKFDNISLADLASLSSPLLSVYLLKQIENLQSKLKVDRFGQLYFNALEKIVLKNLLYEDVKFEKHRVYFKGRLINQFNKISSEIYMKYSEDSQFEQCVKDCKPNTYFRIYSFTYKPFKLVISPMTIKLEGL